MFRRLNYSNVMSTIAVFLALTTGSAYAAITITGYNVKDGTLTGRDIKNGSITASDLASSSVDSSKVKNLSLRSADLAAVDSSEFSTSELDGAQCVRNDTTGYVLVQYGEDGFAQIQCIIPQEGDMYETNDSQAASYVMPTDHADGATFHTPGDVDWYKRTISCPITGNVINQPDSLSFELAAPTNNTRLSVYKGGDLVIDNDTNGEITDVCNGSVTPVALWIKVWRSVDATDSYDLYIHR